ncbi:MAG: tRNA lysidine(34) synthetase TilS [Luteitalea sp.]|nr:tRNA lysidine(34) synthetase TilS [Luteitalea sp.]
MRRARSEDARGDTLSPCHPVEMSRLVASVRSVIREHGLLGPGDRVLVGLSGGPDSVALTHVLRRVAPELDATLSALAHVHHGLRGQEADEDEAFCRRLAVGLGLPILVEHADVRRAAAARRVSIERAAHDLRHACLERARVEAQASVIALGHTRDDQAETFLLRLFRGAGSRGLGGMYPRVGHVVRPLLDITRAQVLHYLSAHGLEFREDTSNRDLTFARNRIRHVVLPQLVREIGPHLPRILARDAALARDDEAWLIRSATEAALEIVLYRESEASAALHLPALRTLSPALQRRIMWLTLQRIAPGRFMGWTHTSAAVALANSPRAHATLALPGVHATRQGEVLTLQAAPADTDREPAKRRQSTSPGRQTFRYELSVPGKAEVREAGLLITAQVEAGGPEWVAQVSNPMEAVLDAKALGRRLVLRSRLPGDRLRPLGFSGTRKLQDLLVDRKVPRAVRDRVPLVAAADGTIAWVVGHAVAEPFRVSPESTAVVFLKATPV